jgi:murein endopeptidase
VTRALALLLVLLGIGSAPDAETEREPIRQPIHYRDSIAIGSPAAGGLERGVRLPPQGRHYFTWDPVEHVSPSPPWRRWGTDELVRTTLRVIRAYGRAHPGAPRVGIGDLSLPEGGYFGPEVSGGIGHATHQNGLDVDVYYPIRSSEERAPLRVDEIRMRLAQDLLDRFVAAGVDLVYVGPSTPLTGPAGVVVPLTNHDNHMHVRITG